MIGLNLDLGVMAFIVVCIWGCWFWFHDLLRWYSVQSITRNDLWANVAGNYVLPYINKKNRIRLSDLDVDIAEYKSDFVLGYDLSLLDNDSRRRLISTVKSKLTEDFCKGNKEIFNANYRVRYDSPFLLIEIAQCGVFGDGTAVAENDTSAPNA